MVKVVEKGFDFDTFSYTRAWITELRCDSIITYRRKNGERKQFDKRIVHVDEKEMRDFFKQLYDFARTAEFSETPIDDCFHKVTFFYDGYHKEEFEGMTHKGSESLIGSIDSFVKRFGSFSSYSQNVIWKTDCVYGVNGYE